MYEERVLKHYAEPFHKGPLPGTRGSTYRGTDVSMPCGDEIIIRARIEDEIITELWWEGMGCCFCLAAASILVEYAEGRTVGEMEEFRNEKLFELFAVEVTSMRRGCVLVSLNALRSLLKDYRCRN